MHSRFLRGKILFMQNTFRLFFFTVVLWGCATLQDRMAEVKRGMSSQEVTTRLGAPVDRTFRGEQELWSYPSSEQGKSKVIVFQKDLVVDMLTASRESATHSIEKSDVNTATKRTYACSENNSFGKFAQGGGCNLHGCWAPGGSCNAFGCSSTGFCAARGCPNKVDSFICQD